MIDDELIGQEHAASRLTLSYNSSTSEALKILQQDCLVALI